MPTLLGLRNKAAAELILAVERIGLRETDSVPIALVTPAVDAIGEYSAAIVSSQIRAENIDLNANDQVPPDKPSQQGAVTDN